MHLCPAPEKDKIDKLKITLSAIDSDRLAAMREVIERDNYCYKKYGYFEYETCTDALIRDEINNILLDRMINN